MRKSDLTGVKRVIDEGLTERDEHRVGDQMLT